VSKTYRLLKHMGDEISTPQVRLILKVLTELTQAAEEKLSDEARAELELEEKHAPVPYQELAETVDANPNFVSRQGAKKVIKFYEKDLIHEGYIKVEGSDAKPSSAKRNNAIAFVEPSDATAPGKEKPTRKAARRPKDKSTDTSPGADIEVAA
jgi:hypothetical protein